MRPQWQNSQFLSLIITCLEEIIGKAIDLSYKKTPLQNNNNKSLD
uniref:Uncharacterized protein n=1 Tax=Anguilla anguilla TaxID=7936 RepID=A0A0E9VZ34_ANGAN